MVGLRPHGRRNRGLGLHCLPRPRHRPLPAARGGGRGLQRRHGSGPGGLRPALDDPDLRRPRHDGQCHGRRRLRLPHRPRRPHHRWSRPTRGCATAARPAWWMHKTDSGGTSQAAFYDLVEVGDLMEWRQASRLLRALHDHRGQGRPDGGSPAQAAGRGKVMTYAFTGCSGAISSTATARLQWGPLLDLGGTSLTAPVDARHLSRSCLRTGPG